MGSGLDIRHLKSSIVKEFSFVIHERSNWVSDVVYPVFPQDKPGFLKPDSRNRMSNVEP